MGGRDMERKYPHPPGLPIRKMCGKVHGDLNDAIGPMAATCQLPLRVVAYEIFFFVSNMCMKFRFAFSFAICEVNDAYAEAERGLSLRIHTGEAFGVRGYLPRTTTVQIPDSAFSKKISAATRPKGFLSLENCEAALRSPCAGPLGL